MLKLRKRLFLILSMVGIILCLVSCIPDGYIKLKFDEELYTIKVGEKLDFMPTVVKDSHESNYELVYESSEQTVATYIDGILTGLKEGTTELKVFVKDNPSVYATTTIQVVYTETLDVEFDVKDKMLKGQTYKISYVLQEGCIDPIITYRSNDDKILTVDNDGYVLAVSKGTTQIIARVTSSVDGIQYREYVFDVTVLEEIYEIEYVLDGGINHPNNPTSYTDSDLPVGLNNPSKTGYTFDGWYLDAECTGDKITELDASMSGKVTLYAKWIATKYSIDYQLDGGLNHPDNPQGYDMLTLPIELLEPTKEDHQFLGWYLNDQLVDKLEVGLEGDITLYAKWEQIAYFITFELDGGVCDNLPTKYFIDEITLLPVPTKEGFKFLGWYFNDALIEQINGEQRGDIVLVAEWKVLEGEIYDVTYIFNGGYSEEYLVAHSGNAPHLTINNYNYNNGTFWGGRYTNDIFIGTSSYDPAATFSDRIYIAKNLETGLYEIVQIISSGASSWPEGAEYVITISNSYNNYWASINPITTKLTVGQMVAFDQAIEDITADEPATVYFFSEVPEDDTLVVPSRYSDKLIVPGYLGYKFLGWYDSEDNLYTSLETLNGDLTLYAKWEQLNPVTNIRVDEICDELETGDTFQIVASVEPSDAYFKDLFYESSNTDIITVSSTGLITAINAGKATITIYDYLRKVAYEHEITVNSIQSVDITFEEHYDGSIHIDDTLQIIATAYGKGTENAKFIYESSDENILTVSETGLVTALANGKANVLVTIEGTQINLSVCITVGVYSEDTDIDRLIALLARNNFAVVETGNISLYNDGVERVYVSTYGSVNRYLFDEFKVDETYYATSEANPNNHKERRSVDTIEFVTVHDTATLTGTVVSIAQGMSSGETSIHYTVGNDAIYGVVPEKYIAYHAGDGTSASFTWTKTNAVATSNIAPQFDVVQSGSAYYLSLNGTVTQIEVPTINGAAPSASYLSILGPTWKVENGYYYIGEPLWYSSSYNTIGSRGGNNNSIGIEMCSNLSGDIYDTFQRTAQLVADILLRNDLDTTRVKMHNTWSGKNCPQTMISGSYWDSFMEMVELQYEIQKNYSNAKISIQSNNPDIIDNTGRVIKAPAITTTVSYDLTVELNGQTKTITLHSIVPGTTTWEQWDGTYPASRIWNNGVFAR